MIIDNLTATETYVEKRMKIPITCNDKHNSNGIIEEDDLGNKLVSIVDSGDTYLYRLSDYKGKDGIILYSEETKQMRLVHKGDDINLRVDFGKGIRYYVGAKRVIATERNEYVFKCELSDANIFKVFLDTGREIKSYTFDASGITVSGADRLYIDDFSELIIYTYTSNSSTTYMNLKETIDNSFVIEYYGYDSIWDLDGFISGEYFKGFKGIEIISFDNLEISQSISKDSIKKNFNNSAITRINAIENTVSLNIFNVSDTQDLVHYIGTSDFRILLINPIFGRIVLINNCKIDDGVSLIFEKERNYKKIGIVCGNYIDINLSNPSEYGLGRYGRGQYGNGVEIWNSARRGLDDNRLR